MSCQAKLASSRRRRITTLLPPTESLKNQSKAKGCCCTVANHNERIVQKLKICDGPFRLVKYGFSKRSFFMRLLLFLIARLARSDPRNSFSSVTNFSRAIYSILVYFVMFSFQAWTCLRIVSIRIILNLNKFRHV